MTVADSHEADPMDFEDFAAQFDAPRFAVDVATNRLPNTSDGQRERIRQGQESLAHRNLIKRDELRSMYERAVAGGAIRPLTRRERLERTAQGDPDNASVQAARRLLAKINSGGGGKATQS